MRVFPTFVLQAGQQSAREGIRKPAHIDDCLV
jgi:hypothetical protein